MNALKNKKGESYIYLCVIIMFVTMLVSVLILYMGLTAQVQAQKRDTKAKLDGYISDYATEIYDALKQGDNYALSIDWNDLESGVFAELGFPSDTTTEYIYANGIKMSRPNVETLSGNGFGLKIEYTAYFPVEWNGTKYVDLQIPVILTSYYKFK